MWVFVVLPAVASVLVVRWRRSGQGLLNFFGLGLVNSYARLWHRWSSNGPAPLPPQGPGLVVSNHTCSSDPTFVVAGCARRVSFLIAAEYFWGPVLRRFFGWLRAVAVTRNGRDVVAVRQSLRNLKEQGDIICIFPEGGLSNAGAARMRHGKAGAALIALRSRVPVYPVSIRGGPQTSDVLRAWLLPSAPARVRVTYGPPLDLSAYYDRPIDRKLLDEVTSLMMQTIADLGSASKIENRKSKIAKRSSEQPACETL
jgi:1-acyl-sn-glycerol-3-phosphate acyltransferase